MGEVAEAVAQRILAGETGRHDQRMRENAQTRAFLYRARRQFAALLDEAFLPYQVTMWETNLRECDHLLVLAHIELKELREERAHLINLAAAL
ncbi:MAG: hypothetical protein LC793_04545 [Thermomicrobia bacterium]|nr:hypothetical protein [Thermomicrobia bacterium]MCA1724641.1 hypothetical protein [Thermomicrobia bacterium]